MHFAGCVRCGGPLGRLPVLLAARDAGPAAARHAGRGGPVRPAGRQEAVVVVEPGQAGGGGGAAEGDEQDALVMLKYTKTLFFERRTT